jgi:2-polyprenyl-3-methyl-5-hydroxy-6-metoxy-1,4-benzoquinol methylase
MDSNLQSEYESKPKQYYNGIRMEMAVLVPASCRRLLEVGCGSGEFAASIKATLGCEAWGVEPNSSAAKEAATKLDRTLADSFHSELALPTGFFDCIVFNDVLEHMIDPDAALRYARKLLTPEGVVVASIPNMRHFPNLWRLVVGGQWEYQEAGIRDRTHLRFFTRCSIAALFEGEGYQLSRLEGINPFYSVEQGDRWLWRYYRVLSLFPVASIKEMRYLQFAVVATPKK